MEMHPLCQNVPTLNLGVSCRREDGLGYFEGETGKKEERYDGGEMLQ